MKTARAALFGAIFAGWLACAGCAESHNTGHDVNLGGVRHRAGVRDPRGAGCPTCHGDDLRGGQGPSCYSCHSNSGHPELYGGVRHNRDVDCTRCHGPNNDGGLGSACATRSCHG